MRKEEAQGKLFDITCRAQHAQTFVNSIPDHISAPTGIWVEDDADKIWLEWYKHPRMVVSICFDLTVANWSAIITSNNETTDHSGQLTYASDFYTQELSSLWPIIKKWME